MAFYIPVTLYAWVPDRRLLGMSYEAKPNTLFRLNHPSDHRQSLFNRKFTPGVAFAQRRGACGRLFIVPACVCTGSGI